MLFRKYHIVVFREKQGSCRKMQLRAWLLLGVLALFAGLAAGNVYLFQHFRNYNSLQHQLSASERTVQDQKTQLLSLSQKIVTLQKDLTRIQDFDSKLRVMINLDQDSTYESSSKGGTPNADFSKDYLPLHRQELLARKMHDFLRQLNVEARLEEVSQQEILQQLRANREVLESTPSIWPVTGWVTSGFGWRTSPFTGKRDFHKGLDISNARGTPIYAPAAGTVISAGRDGSYGISIRIKHSATVMTRYGHMSKLAVRTGQTVTRGELIGYIGNTGRSTGPHLHYEVRLSGVPVNPLRYILN